MKKQLLYIYPDELGDDMLVLLDNPSDIIRRDALVRIFLINPPAHEPLMTLTQDTYRHPCKVVSIASGGNYTRAELLHALQRTLACIDRIEQVIDTEFLQ